MDQRKLRFSIFTGAFCVLFALLLINILLQLRNGRRTYEQSSESKVGSEIPSGAVPSQVVDTGAKATAQKQSGSIRIGDSGLGYSFTVPPGWQAQKTANNITLTNPDVAGHILIFATFGQTRQQVLLTMREGVLEEGVVFLPESQIRQMGNDTFAGQYTGSLNGQPVKVRGIGMFYEDLGGVYIGGIASPEQYSRDLSNAADTIVNSMQFKKPEVPAQLIEHFSGPWWSFNNGEYETAYLSANGDYKHTYESSVYAENTNTYGEVTSYGSSFTEQCSSGTWTVRGDVNKGVIIIRFHDGSQESLPYRVYVQNGKAYYSEYLIGGIHWKKGTVY